MRRIAVLLLALGAFAALPSAGASMPGGRTIKPREVQQLRDAAAVTLAAGPREYSLEVLIQIDEDPPDPDRTYQPFTAEGVIDPATGASVATFGIADADFPDSATANTLEITAPSATVTYVGTRTASSSPPGRSSSRCRPSS